jgi:hypothetical protein
MVKFIRVTKGRGERPLLLNADAIERVSEWTDGETKISFIGQDDDHVLFVRETVKQIEEMWWWQATPAKPAPQATQ